MHGALPLQMQMPLFFVSHIEIDGRFISKYDSIANYFNQFYSNKIMILNSNMSKGDS